MSNKLKKTCPICKKEVLKGGLKPTMLVYRNPICQECINEVYIPLLKLVNERLKKAMKE